MDKCQTGGDRGVSPVLAVVLLLAVSVALAAVAAGFVFSNSDAISTTAPQTQFDVNPVSNSELQLLYDSGTQISGSNTDEIVVYVDDVEKASLVVNDVYNRDNRVLVPDSTQSESVDGISASAVTVRVVWVGPDTGRSEVLYRENVTMPS